MKYQIVDGSDKNFNVKKMLHLIVSDALICFVCRNLIESFILQTAYKLAIPHFESPPQQFYYILDLSCYESLNSLCLDRFSNRNFNNSVTLLLDPETVHSNKNLSPNINVESKSLNDLLIESLLNSAQFKCNLIYAANPSDQLLETLEQFSPLAEIQIDIVQVDNQNISLDPSYLIQLSQVIIDNLPVNPFVNYKLLAEFAIKDSLAFVSNSFNAYFQFINSIQPFVHQQEQTLYKNQDIIQKRKKRSILGSYERILYKME